jgi:hypothetical protein
MDARYPKRPSPSPKRGKVEASVPRLGLPRRPVRRDAGGSLEFGHGSPAPPGGDAPPSPGCYSAVVGSITVRTSETRFAGNPPIWACFLTVASSGAM